jgi:hypothetical protein
VIPERPGLMGDRVPIHPGARWFTSLVYDIQVPLLLKGVPAEGLQAFDCLKQNVKRLPPACRKAVQAL